MERSAARGVEKSAANSIEGGGEKAAANSIVRGGETPAGPSLYKGVEKAPASTGARNIEMIDRDSTRPPLWKNSRQVRHPRNVPTQPPSTASHTYFRWILRAELCQVRGGRGWILVIRHGMRTRDPYRDRSTKSRSERLRMGRK
jgi:hypothetical protein